MTTNKAEKLTREDTVESLLVEEAEGEKVLTVREKIEKGTHYDGGPDSSKRAEHDSDKAPVRPASACCSREKLSWLDETQRPKSALDCHDLQRFAKDADSTLNLATSSELVKAIPTTNMLLRATLGSFDLLARDSEDDDLTNRDLRSTLRDLLDMQHKIMSRVGRLELCNGLG